MKELGTRREGDNLITIAELNEYEMSVLTSLLEARDLEAEAEALEAWAKRFGDKVRTLDLDQRTTNAVLRQVYSRERSNADWTFALTEDGTPLEFDDWARRIVATHDGNGKLIKRSYPMLLIRNLGAKGRATLMSALIEYVGK